MRSWPPWRPQAAATRPAAMAPHHHHHLLSPALGLCHLGAAASRASHSGELGPWGYAEPQTPPQTPPQQPPQAPAPLAPGMPMVPWLFPWDPPPMVDLTGDDADE
jgi:hypothetical protein